MDSKRLYAFSNAKIIILFLIFNCLFKVYSEDNYYQWQFQKISVNDEYGDIYNVFLYDSILNEKYYILSLTNHMVPKIKNDINVTLNGCVADSVVWSWWAGGGMGCSLFINDDELRVYKTVFDEGSEPIVENILFKNKIQNCKLYEKKAVYFDAPSFYRNLSLTVPHMYGDDVFYLQSILVNIYMQDIEIDGYFGSQTESAVRNLQKKKEIPITGIVNELLWNEILNFF